MQNCGSCTFWRSLANGRTGTCHAVPPTPVMVGMGQNPVTNEPVPVILTYWPEVPPAAFCGRYTIGKAGLAKIDMTKVANVSAEGSA